MSERRVRLEPIRVKIKKERDWLFDFIRAYHSSPAYVLPSHEDLINPHFHYFRAKALGIGDRSAEKVVGITSYEKKTKYLAETQKTIVAPEFRGQGWGKLLSRAIEDEVRRRGFRKIRTTIYASNLAMIAIKLEQGYRIEGFHPDHEGPGLDEYSFGKILDRNTP
jgi:GNAT superfamily N-acetyltransferase